MEANVRRSLVNKLKKDEDIDGLKSFIRSERMEYPNNKDRAKYLAFSNLFTLEANGQLFHIEPRLEVIKSDDVQDKLNQIYNNIQQSLGKGIKSLYYFVSSKYLNISRKECELFLKTKPIYNMTRVPVQRVKYSLPTYTACRQAFMIDHIDVSRIRGHNNNTDYILTIVDGFSKKVWLTPSRTKNMNDTANLFNQRIIQNDIKPKLVIADNAFKGEFRNLLHNNLIKLHHKKIK